MKLSCWNMDGRLGLSCERKEKESENVTESAAQMDTDWLCSSWHSCRNVKMQKRLFFSIKTYLVIVLVVFKWGYTLFLDSLTSKLPMTIRVRPQQMTCLDPMGMGTHPGQTMRRLRHKELLNEDRTGEGWGVDWANGWRYIPDNGWLFRSRWEHW